MYTFLYDENLLKNAPFPQSHGIFFYINNDNDYVYYYGNWGGNELYYAILEVNRIFKGWIELPRLRDRPLTNLIGLDFFFEQSRVKIEQTVVVSTSTRLISDDLMVKEVLSVYDVPKELDPFFNVYDTIKLITQCKDIDTLKLYELSALPYLHNCSIDGIMKFADSYNANLLRIL